MDTDTIIGARPFTDVSTRMVYRDTEGRYVGDDGADVYGVWLLTDEDDNVAPCASTRGLPGGDSLAKLPARNGWGA